MKTKVYLLTLLLFFISTQFYAQSVYLPTSHWIYPLFDRLETKGVINDLSKNSQPYTREFIANILLNLDSRNLTPIEKDLIQRAKGEFYDELKDELSIHKEIEPHFYRWISKDNFASFDLLMGTESQLRIQDSENITVQHPYYGAIVRGQVFGLGFYSDNQIHSEWGLGSYNQHYTPSQGYPQSISEDSSRIIWDQSVSYLRLDIRGIQLEYGRNQIKWGPSPFGGLMFSDQTPAIDLFRLQIPIGKANFTWLHGKLASDFNQKWITAHRLDLTLRNNLNVGVSEVLIYGNRDIEWAYFNPVLPYLVAEHTLGDKDNLAIGLDVEWRVKNRLKLYGDFFIDDLFAPWEIFSDFWGNRLAFSLGGQWLDPLGLENTSCFIEYTRIEPYVYTHEDSVNTYEHYNYSLGRQLQPNADQWIFYIQKWLHRNISVNIQYSRIRHGIGDRRRPHFETDGETKEFLGDLFETSSELSLRLTVQPYRDLFVQLFYKPISQKNIALVKNNNIDWIKAGCSVNLNW